MLETITGFNVSIEISIWIAVVTTVLGIIWTLLQKK